MSIFAKCENLKNRCITKAMVKRHHAVTLELGKTISIRDGMEKLVHSCWCELRPIETMKLPLNLKNGSGTGINMKCLSPLVDYELH
jgi:hypothetical protein